MNNFDYQMFLNGTSDVLSDMFLQGMNSNSNNNNNNNSNNDNNGMSLFNNNHNKLNNNMNNNTNNNLNNNLYGSYEGFMKGNMFKNLYEPFRNYRPIQITPRNAREEALLNLDQTAFAMHEINLYLDNFPDDQNMINQFNEFRKAYDEMLNNYQSKYGPISINNPYMTESPFAWTKDSWPWDRRKF